MALLGVPLCHRPFVYRCPMGMTQRKALRIGRRHQKEGEHSQRCMPAFSAARVPSAAHTHSPAAMAMPRLIATAYDGLVAGTPV